MFDRLVRRIGDGHVSIEWRRAAALASGAVAASSEPTNICDAMGFDRGRSTAGIGASLSGYRAVGADGPFPAGIVPVGERQIGVIRIGVFEPQGSPALCGQALRALHVPIGKPCDDGCQDAILTWTYDRLTEALEDQVRAVQRDGATVLLVDITDNGGGTEWAEAAALILSPKLLVSERRGYVRGPHWSAMGIIGTPASSSRSIGRSA